MKSFNLESLGKKEISFYLAVEEFVLNNFEEDTFFLWDLNPSIIIGRHQLLEAEVNVKLAMAEKIAIYRRPSGGGAIYADDGCFMFSFITKKEKTEEIYKTYLPLITGVLKDLGLKAEFSGRNDLLFNRKKFSGNALYKTKNGTVLHGTFLYNSNLEQLEKMITPDNVKLFSKGIKSVKDRVINIGQYLNKSKKEVMRQLIETIGDNILELKKEEIELIFELEKKYLTKEWIFGSNPRYNFFHEQRFSWGKISFSIDVSKNIVKNIVLNGDFFPLQEIKDFTNYFIGKEFQKAVFWEVLKTIDVSNYILNSQNEDFIIAIFGGEN